MKRFVFTVLCAAVLSGCSSADIPEETTVDTLYNTEKETTQYTEEATIQYTEKTKPAETSPAPDEIRYVTLPQTEAPVVTSCAEYTFEQAENMSDEELIALANSEFTTETYISDYYPVNRKAAPVTLNADDDFESYCADISHYPSAYDDNMDVVLEKIEGNEYYAEWRNAYTEVREYYSNDELVRSYIEREYFRIMLKNFRRIDGKVKYMGEMSEEDIKNNFDISEAYDYPQKLCRRVTVTDDGADYEFIYFQRCYGDWGIDDTASLYLNKIHISPDGELSPVIYNGLIKECSIPGTAPQMYWDD